MKTLKEIYDNLDNEGKMMLHSLVDLLMLTATIGGSLLLIAYFIAL
jgi:hypothetical protein